MDAPIYLLAEGLDAPPAGDDIKFRDARCWIISLPYLLRLERDWLGWCWTLGWAMGLG